MKDDNFVCALDPTYQDEHMAGLFDAATLAASTDSSSSSDASGGGTTAALAGGRHSSTSTPLYPLPDPDPLMSTPLADSRKAFLGVCQHLHLQFDTRRNAKYSTMLLLHRLLHPSLPAAADEAFVCSVCQAVVLKNKHWFDAGEPTVAFCDACARSTQQEQPRNRLVFADRTMRK